MSKNQNYRTPNLVFAAYLIAKGSAKLVRASNGPTNTEFTLSAEPTGEDVTAFFNGSGTVSALRFSETITNLKAILHETCRRARSRGGDR